ncbi:MAG: histidine phosphatase family protein [Candidatus Heimdallarchaeota archaeon]
MKIILIRHGQSTANELIIIQGQKDYPLTELGEQQAKKLAHKMLQDKFSCNGVYSSDLTRAKRTTEILAEILGLEVAKYDERLREMNFGHRQGKKVANLTPEEKQYEKRVFEEHDLKFPEGESVNDMKNRVNESLEEIINSHDEKDTILIVGHGGTLYHILFHILNIFPEGDEWFKTAKIHFTSNCSYNEIYRESSLDKWQLKIFNSQKL